MNFSQYGIQFGPSAAATLSVADTSVHDCGNSGSTGGIVVKPNGAGSASVAISRCQIDTNTAGIRADSSGSSGAVRGVVRDTRAAGNTFNGITAVSGSATSQLLVDHCSVASNAFGLVVNGANASLLVTNTS